MIDTLSIATNGYLSKYKRPLSIATDGYLSVFALLAIAIEEERRYSDGDGPDDERQEMFMRISDLRREDQEILLIIQIFMTTWQDY